MRAFVTAEGVAALELELAQAKAERDEARRLAKIDREAKDAARAHTREVAAELVRVKQGWAEDDARLQRAEEGWAETKADLLEAEEARHPTLARRYDELATACKQSGAALREVRSELAQVKAELATARATISEDDKMRHAELLAVDDPGKPGIVPAKWVLEAQWQRDEAVRKGLDLAESLNADKLVAEDERDTALRHLQAVLSHSFAFERGHDFPQEAAARAFLLSIKERDA